MTDCTASMREERGQLARVSRSKGTTFTTHGPICDLNLGTLDTEVRPSVLGRMEQSLRLSAPTRGSEGGSSSRNPRGSQLDHRGEDWMANLDNMKYFNALGGKLGVEVVIENISAGHAILGDVKDFLTL